MFKVKDQISNEDVYTVEFFYNHRSTLCEVVEHSEDLSWWGRTIKSEKDYYNKSTGQKYALARAIVDLPKDTRKLFWDAYLKNYHPEVEI